MILPRIVGNAQSIKSPFLMKFIIVIIKKIGIAIINITAEIASHKIATIIVKILPIYFIILIYIFS